MKKIISVILIMMAAMACKTTVVNKKTPINLLDSLLATTPLLFKDILTRKDELRIQVIYTQVDRDKNNRPTFTDYFYNINDSLYFYPASTVKMPAALLALEKLKELNIKGLNRKTTMDAGTRESTDETQLKPTSVEHYIKEIFLVSDNNAFNSLYEFLGQQYIKDKLTAKGYPSVEIKNRLQLSLTEEQNRRTNAISFYDTAGIVVYQQPAAYSHAIFSKRSNLLGKAFVKGDSIIQQPFDFSNKNRVYLRDLHSIMRSIIFPYSVSEQKRFNISEDDYRFLYRYMSAHPAESNDPKYDTSIYHDNYSKFLLFGSQKQAPPSTIRIFNKEGDAYGFLTDIAYIVDFENKIEFMISATVYCNGDGVFNDDIYDYDSIGFPFLKNLGTVIYNYEKQRHRNFKPDLSNFIIDYKKE
jgi:hypothetical protein